MKWCMIKNQIKKITYYKKPAFWIVLGIAAVVILFVICFLENPYEVVAGGKYVYDNGGLNHATVVILDEENADFNYSMLSSYIPRGKYRITGNRLEINDGGNIYTFKIKNEKLIFDAENSEKIPEYGTGENREVQPSVPDGAVFYLVCNVITEDTYFWGHLKTNW